MKPTLNKATRPPKEYKAMGPKWWRKNHKPKVHKDQKPKGEDQQGKDEEPPT